MNSYSKPAPFLSGDLFLNAWLKNCPYPSLQKLKMLCLALLFQLIFWAWFSVSPAHAADPGDLDPTFGLGGIVTTTIGTADEAHDIVIQRDGKIIVAGAAKTGATDLDFALVRYLPDGSLDSDFGSGGYVITYIQDGLDTIPAVALQNDGKIVAAGVTIAGATGKSDVALARYEPDGSLDADFGIGGIVTTSVSTDNDVAYDVAIQPDGKVVVIGYASFNDANHLLLARYHSNGDLDTGFGAGGIVTTSLGIQANGQAVVLQDDGKIVVGGFSHSGQRGGLLLVRYDSSGNLDPSFGINGIATHASMGFLSWGGLVLQPDGKIVIAGPEFNYDSGSLFAYDLLLARFDEDGILDTGFGTNGTMITDLGGTEVPLDMALQSNGKIVVSGYRSVSDQAAFLVARYEPDGDLDTQFGNMGAAITYPTPDTTASYSIAIQPDGKIVVAGTGSITPSTIFAVARYLGDPTIHILETDGTTDTSEAGVLDTYEVVLTSQPTGDVTVDIQSDTQLDTSVNNLVVTSTNWDITRTITVTAVDDSLYEGPHTGLISHTTSSSDNDYNNLSLASIRANIADNDDPPNLSIKKTVELAQSPPEPGDPLTYTIVISNTGSDASGVSVTDTLPDYITGANLNQTVTLSANQALTFTLTAHIADDAPYGLTITNTAGYSHSSGSGQASAGFQMVNDTTAPSFPTNPLITPTGQVETRRPLFDWLDALDDQSGVVSYTLVLTGPETLSLQTTTTITTDQSVYTPTLDLAVGAYTWTVRAHDKAGNTGPYASPASFVIAGPANGVVYLPVILNDE